MKGLVVTLLVAFMVTLPLFAAVSNINNNAAPIGELHSNAEFGLHTEEFVLQPEVLNALRLGVDVIEIDFPSAPGEREHFVIRKETKVRTGRSTVYENGTECMVPSSDRIRYIGRIFTDPSKIMAISVASDGSFRGLVNNGQQWYEYAAGTGRIGTLTERSHVVRKMLANPLRPAAPFNRPGYELGPMACTGDDSQSDFLDARDLGRSYAKSTTTVEYYTTVAFDIDSSMMLERFGDDPIAAQDEVEDLILYFNTIAEGDLGVHVYLGDILMRIGTDPYANTDSPPTQDTLDEVALHWQDNHGDISRVFTFMLSGNSPDETVGSWISNLDGFCENQVVGGGYAVIQAHKALWVPITAWVRLFQAAYGRLSGSVFTHCENPPVDTCAIELGCNQDPLACPATTLQGTAMSLCYVSAPLGPNCGANLLEYHPVSAWTINGYHALHVSPTCVQVADPAEIFSDGFETGDFSGWSFVAP